ncbi:GroES-like protein [Saccharata proteae CBS 121410]|uniref:GroES-like protein n=1 Tax=Saccharata proteae CBS 121410 TaxID=1314787 RepID=A0A9P4HU05_9PEZI|nr:GroES-like protein [Saccharata proteae CBS 121410]
MQLMRAARYYGKEDIRIEEIPEEQCGPGQVKVSPAYVGICGTDLHEYLGGPTFAPVTPHPVTGETIPITFGHEFSGVIKEIGEGVEGFEVGMKVAVQPTICCRTCPTCIDGIENACPSGGFIGLSGSGGGLSSSINLPPSSIHPLPESIPLDIGALVEPLSVAWHAVDSVPTTDLNSSSTVLVLGGGPIGLAVVQCLKARGAGKVIMSEIAAQRQAFAREFGADHVLCPKTYDLVALSRELSGGKGPDVVFDCAGVAASLTTACMAVRARGTVVNVAIWEKPVPFQPNMLVFKEAKYAAVLGYQRKDFEAVIRALADGKLTPARMITKRIQLEDLVEEGFMPLINQKDKNVKILVEMDPGLDRVDSLTH